MTTPSASTRLLRRKHLVRYTWACPLLSGSCGANQRAPGWMAERRRRQRRAPIGCIAFAASRRHFASNYDISVDNSVAKAPVCQDDLLTGMVFTRSPASSDVLPTVREKSTGTGLPIAIDWDGWAAVTPTATSLSGQRLHRAGEAEVDQSSIGTGAHRAGHQSWYATEQ